MRKRALGLPSVVLLASRSQIEEPGDLRNALVAGAFMLVSFVAGERIHPLPAVTALMGASVLRFLVRPDIEEMIDLVAGQCAFTDAEISAFMAEIEALGVTIDN